mmetsp:Transcript_31417/g.52770  ORF Transcript_31417/g.52770 Transcript_31417/m.52770 type:complete len:522 (-) Transcript_31417:111-1676(-)
MMGLSSDDDDDFTMSQAYNNPMNMRVVEKLIRNKDEGSARGGQSESYVPGRTINDDIHGHVYLTAKLWDVVDTPEFQRLRYLKQLGSTYWVYPGATHNRFEHSIGVCHLGQMQASLFKNRQKELNLTRFDIEAISYAGLCHDIGHGPFSHVFENEFLPKAYEGRGYTSCHEGHSVTIWKRLIEKNALDIDKDMEERVSALIASSLPANKLRGEKAFLGDIIANGRNSIDVDKMDYLARDAQNCNVKISCDFDRLLRFTKVIDNEICFKAGDVSNVYQLFWDRASMHDRVYTHKKGKAIEYMIVDALLAADKAKDGEYSKSINDMDEYLKLDDTLLRRIEVERVDETDSHPMLKEAQAIIKRLQKRDLYKYVHEFVVPKDKLENYKNVTPEDILACQNPDGAISGGLKPDDIIVHNLKIDYCKGGRNPLDLTRFFRNYSDTASHHYPAEKVGFGLPGQFLIRKVRVFSRNSSDPYVKATRDAFEEYIRSNRIAVDSAEAFFSTPLKTARKRNQRFSHSEGDH